jgi:transcriptional regulator with XRE-family HTH domain
MNINKCFDETLKRHGITGAVLAKKVGISPSHISQFRNGKGGAVSHTTLEEILNAMEELAPGSKKYFCYLLAEGQLSEGKTGLGKKLVEMIELADDDDI